MKKILLSALIFGLAVSLGMFVLMRTFGINSHQMEEAAAMAAPQYKIPQIATAQVCSASLDKENSNIEEDVSLYEVVMLHLKYSEGIRLQEYECAAGVKTIGWGTTKTAHTKMTMEEANRKVATKFQQLYNAMGEVYPHLSRQKKLALASMRYNVGPFGPNLHNAIKSDNTDKVTSIMRKYVTAKVKQSRGRVKREILQGLVSRREREVILYSGNLEQLIALRDRLKPLVKKKIIKAKSNS